MIKTELTRAEAESILSQWGVDANLPKDGLKLHVNLPPNKSGYNLATFVRKNKDKFELKMEKAAVLV